MVEALVKGLEIGTTVFTACASLIVWFGLVGLVMYAIDGICKTFSKR